MGPSLTLVLSAGERDVFMEAGSERCCVAGFEDRKRKPQVKEKTRKQFSCRASRKKRSSVDTLILVQRRPCWICDLWYYNITTFVFLGH